MDTPPWGTPSGEGAAAGSEHRGRRSRLIGFAIAIAVVVACGALLVEAVTTEEDNAVLDVAVALVMLALMVAALAAVGFGFRWLLMHGFVWWARLASLSLLVVSAWATTLANSYGDSHYRPDGTVTPLADLLVIPPATGVIAALVGIGLAWVWSFTPAGRAAMRDHGTEDAPPAPSGWPAEDAQPPFTFRVPHHEAWHQLVLPMSLVLFALLAVVSILVRDPGPVLLPGFFVLLLSPFGLLAILPAYQRQLVVRPDGLYVKRTLSTRFVRWQELNDIEIAPDRSSQHNHYKMWLTTTTGRYGTDVPKAPSAALEHWRQVILAARPAVESVLGPSPRREAEGPAARDPSSH